MSSRLTLSVLKLCCAGIITWTFNIPTADGPRPCGESDGAG